MDSTFVRTALDEMLAVLELQFAGNERQAMDAIEKADTLMDHSRVRAFWDQLAAMPKEPENATN